MIVVCNLRARHFPPSSSPSLPLPPQETIANLSNKVETLRMEIASLRHSMNTPMANELGEPPLAMFTRLDYDHNTRELQSALNTEQLSPTVYRKVNDDMSKYLTIPSQRLVHIGKRSREKELAEKLVCNVRHEYRDRGDVAERVVGKIRSREEQQQRRFEKKMDELRVKRTSLARTLTSQLGEMETDMNVILIKPIYGSIGRSQHQDLITPLPRPVPNRTPQPPRSQSWSRVVSAMGRRGRGRAEEGGTEGGGARSVRLVTTRQEAHRGDTVTAGMCAHVTAGFLHHPSSHSPPHPSPPSLTFSLTLPISSLTILPPSHSPSHLPPSLSPLLLQNQSELAATPPHSLPDNQ